MLQADDVVDQRGLRSPRRQVVALRHGNRDLLVAARDDLGRDISTVGHERFVHPARGRARVQRDVLDAKPIEQIDDEVGHVLRFVEAHRRSSSCVAPPLGFEWVRARRNLKRQRARCQGLAGDRVASPTGAAVRPVSP